MSHHRKDLYCHKYYRYDLMYILDRISPSNPNYLLLKQDWESYPGILCHRKDHQHIPDQHVYEIHFYCQIYFYLCAKLINLKAVYYHKSCCGHGKNSFRIWFKVKGLKYLPPLLYWFDGCHSGLYGWTVRVRTDCAMSPVHFCAECRLKAVFPKPDGTVEEYPENPYAQAEHIAGLMVEYLEGNKNRRRNLPKLRR